MAKSKLKKKDIESRNRNMAVLLTEKGKWIQFKDLFQLQKKNKTITLRVSGDLLSELKKIAQREKTDYQKLVRNLIIEYVAKKGM